MPLEFKPHYLGIEGMTQAKANGFSVVHGWPIRGYEIMYPNGEVQSGFTLEEAEKEVFGKGGNNG